MKDSRALSQGFEPGHDPYDSDARLRGTTFGQTRAQFHADEAWFSIADEEIRYWISKDSRIKPAGPEAVKQASYSAIALEADRGNS